MFCEEYTPAVCCVMLYRGWYYFSILFLDVGRVVSVSALINVARGS